MNKKEYIKILDDLLFMSKMYHTKLQEHKNIILNADSYSAVQGRHKKSIDNFGIELHKLHVRYRKDFKYFIL